MWLQLSEVRKQHATAEQTISAKHRLEILREAADSTRQRLESEAAISELNVKLIAAEGSFVELDAFSQKEPQRQAEAIRLALVMAAAQYFLLRGIISLVLVLSGECRADQASSNLCCNPNRVQCP